MNIGKPVRVILFLLDLARLFFLAAAFVLFTAIRIPENSGLFPHLVYLSANALFPLITFFMLIKPLEYRNYVPLYIAGKTISVILFYIWAVLTLPYETGFVKRENFNDAVTLLGCVFLISLEDVISIFVTLLINKKTRSPRNDSENDSGNDSGDKSPDEPRDASGDESNGGQ